ncbi:MAG: hypothetical protein C0493_12660 [Kytococcus sp.]|nr:hypothetical protein [Kytococcus sp.]
MTLPHRPGRSAAAAALTLALAACGGAGEGTARPGTSPSSGGSSSATVAPDPSVRVTQGEDAPQSAAEARAGTRAADAETAATSLSIPAVGLSTRIEPQGLRGGKVNPSPGEVIWFTGYDRVQPGAKGTTVIAGHVISSGRPDAFAALEQLAKGDGVVLGYPGGARLRFEVTSTRIVDKEALTTSEDVWGTNPDTRRIVLITCDDQLGFREDGHRRANFVAVAEIPA